MPATPDTSIPLSIKPPDNFLQTLGSIYALKGQQQDQQLRGQQIQQGQQGWSDQQAVRAAIQHNTKPDPQTGAPTLDRSGVLGELQQTAPTQALTLGQQFLTQDIQRAKAQQEFTKTDLENAKSRVNLMGQLANGINNQNSYDSALQRGIQEGLLKPGQAPAVYDPQVVAGWQNDAMTADQHLTTLQKQQEMTETGRHNQADEALRAKSIPLANQAAAAYGVPAAQRTPVQNALLSGYEQQVRTAYVNPRVAAALARPVQVADPNNPGNIQYTSAGTAMRSGLSAPGSATTQAAIDTTRAGSAGQIGNTLTAFHTAQGHLGQLAAATTALKNGDVQSLNKIANMYGVATGKSAPVVFDTVKTALSGEIAKAFTGAGATVSEIGNIQKSIHDAASPAQLQAIIGTYSGLLNTKIGALKSQYDQGVKGQANFQGNPAAPPSSPSDFAPGTHTFNLNRWMQANPKGNPKAAAAQARQQGFQVVQ